MDFPTHIIPDPETRAGRMLLAGQVRVTVTSKATGEHITIRFKAALDNRENTKAGHRPRPRPDLKKNWPNVPLAEATHVFIDVPTPDDGFGDKVGTHYPLTGKFYSDRSADPARIFAASAAAHWLNGTEVRSPVEIAEEERCGACGRELTDPESIARGIGPVCLGAATGSVHQTKERPEREPAKFDPDADFADEHGDYGNSENGDPEPEGAGIPCMACGRFQARDGDCRCYV